MTNIITFPARRYDGLDRIDLAPYINQIKMLTDDMQRYAEFMKREADKFCAEVRCDASIAPARTEALVGYIHEMNKKSALMEQICKTMQSVNSYNETTKVPHRG